MAFWLGMMRIVQEGGLLHGLARWLRPVMTRLFPEVPADHPAMSAMIMNIATNMLGLGNAATPFGIKAMVELNRPTRCRASPPTRWCCSSPSTPPTSPRRRSASAWPCARRWARDDAAGIWLPTLFATSCSTVLATAAKVLQRVVWPASAYAPSDAPAAALTCRRPRRRRAGRRATDGAGSAAPRRCSAWG
ncbi:MAG: nucleoside recognition domain-containing protein [Candidatus Binatia bacterium]